MKITIICPVPVSGQKGDKITIYKNTEGLYVVILNGVEIGLASELNSESDITEIPSCMEGILGRDYQNVKTFKVEL